MISVPAETTAHKHGSLFVRGSHSLMARLRITSPSTITARTVRNVAISTYGSARTSSSVRSYSSGSLSSTRFGLDHRLASCPTSLSVISAALHGSMQAVYRTSMREPTWQSLPHRNAGSVDTHNARVNERRCTRRRRDGHAGHGRKLSACSTRAVTSRR